MTERAPTLAVFMHAHASSTEFTHVSMPPTTGSFKIEGADLEKFRTLYTAHIAKPQAKPLAYLERPLEVEGLKIDLDFRHTPPLPGSKPVRQFTDAQVRAFATEVLTTAVTLFTCPNRLHAVIAQRSGPYVDEKGVMKDGVHVQIPHLVITKEERQGLRHLLLDADIIGRCFAGVEMLEPPEKVFDVAVLNNVNGWFLYGSSKDKREPYRVTAMIDATGRDFPIPTMAKLVTLLSNRWAGLPQVERRAPRNEAFDTAIVAALAPKKSTAASRKVTKVKGMDAIMDPVKTPRIPDREFQRITKAVELLSDARAGTYQEWRDVVWSIYGACGYTASHVGDVRAKDLAEAFSTRGGAKYVAGSAHVKGLETTGTMGLGTLIMNAREDNPKEADRRFPRVPFHATPMTDMDYARYFFSDHGDRFIYRGGVWYCYTGVYWQRDEEGLALRLCLSEIFLPELLATLPPNKEVPPVMDDDKASVQAAHEARAANHTLQRLRDDITTKLGDAAPKRGVVESLKEWLCVPDSVQFDTHRNLFVFENAVYDLHLRAFVTPDPKTYSATTCGYMWEPIDPKDTVARKARDARKAYVHGILRGLVTDEDGGQTADFLMLLLAHVLEGINRNEKVFFLTGIGRNGKSTVMDLMQLVLGLYYGRISMEFFTTENKHPEGPKPELYALRNKRVAVATEPDDSAGGAGAVVRNRIMRGFTGNDDQTARDCNARSHQIVTFKAPPLIIPCNALPDYKNKHDTAMPTRPCVVDFPYRFVPAAEFVAGAVKGEKVMIENLKRDLLTPEYRLAFIELLFEYYEKYRAAGFKLDPPAAVLASSNRYKEEMCEGKAWAVAHLRATPGAVTPVKVICDAWNVHNREDNPEWRTVITNVMGKTLRTWGYATEQVHHAASVIGFVFVPDVA